MTPSSKISGLFLEVPPMKEKQKLPTKFHTLVSALLGEGNHSCVSLCCTWGLGNRVSVQKRTLASRWGSGLGCQASWSCAQASEAKSGETSAHVAAHGATVEVKSWIKNSSRLGALLEPRFPSDSLLNKLITSLKAALSNRTFCDDGNVLYLPHPRW